MDRAPQPVHAIASAISTLTPLRAELEALSSFVSGIKEVHFFGDKFKPGGNDYEIYSSDKTIGHAIESANPTETVAKCKELFFKEAAVS